MFLKQTEINPNFNINNLAGEGRMDLLCRTFTNVFFLANDFRNNANLYAFFQKESILIKFIGSRIKKVLPDERSIAGYLKKVFRIIMENSSKSTEFEWEYLSLEDIPRKYDHGFLLDDKGVFIDQVKFQKDYEIFFFLGDHLGLNENEKAFLSNFQCISLGNTVLLGSQCITVIYHYIDKM
jgi:tRNA pseudouridine-54 N-methylase